MKSVSDFCFPHVGDAVLCAAEPTVDPSIANCDFENGLCLYYQERAESKVWTRMSVQPNAYRTGDHTTGAGEWIGGAHANPTAVKVGGTGDTAAIFVCLKQQRQLVLSPSHLFLLVTRQLREMRSLIANHALCLIFLRPFPRG